jgi:diguanylate cyclase (GGDEF)-like protein/PAS domain S-box-containing protein
MNTHFDARFGQELCDQLSTELGLVCSFMGAEGRIVASSVRERIGTIHDKAGQIMRGEIDEYSVSRDEAAQSATMREGVNMAIDFEGSRLVVFGIAGPLEVVRPLARIVRFCVTSLLRVRQDAQWSETPVAPANGAPAKNTTRLMETLSHASVTIENSLSRLRDAVENIDQGITMFDADLRLVVWNKRFLELINMPQKIIAFGLPLEAIVRYYAENAQHGAGEIEEILNERMAVVRRRQSNSYEHVMPSGIVLEMVDRPLSNGGFVTTYTDVTSRSQAKAALSAAYDSAERLVEERTRDLRQFAELSSDWIWVQDAEFRFIEFSGHSMGKLGRSQSDFLGLRRWDMPISGITPEQLAEHIASCERHESFRDLNYEIPGTDGLLQYYSISGTPVFDEQGVFAGYHGVGRNITELRLAERAIKESERLLSQIVDGTSIPIFVIDANHRITHWNQACVSLTGLDAGQMLGSKDAWRAFYVAPRSTLADLIVTGADDDEIARQYQKSARCSLIGGAFEAEVFYPDAGDGGRWLFFTAAPLRDSEGKLTGAIETLQDVTDQRREQKLLEDKTEALQRAYANVEERVAERTAELSQQLNFQHQLIEAIPDPVFYKDAEARYLGCNSAFEVFIGRSASEIIGKTPHDIAPRELADKYFAADRELLDNSGTQIYESLVRYANGEMRDVIFHKATFTRSDGTVGGIVGVMLDITERKRMEDDLRQAATVFESAAEGVTITSHDGSIIAVNRAFTEITGYAESEVIGRNPSILQSGRHDKNFYRKMWESITSVGRWQGEVWNRRKNGELFPEWISITAVRDKQGRLTNYVATFSDITQHKKNEERIQTLAFSDALTNLPNRRLLVDRLQHALAACSRDKRFGALFFIDLDDFKNINDALGHDKGDLLLKQVAQRLTGCIRVGDTVARLGGDEFVVILENLSEKSLEASSQSELLGKKILACLNEPYMLEEYLHHSTPSIGITLFGGQPTSVEELLKQADLAMYKAKESGRNTLRFFDPEMQIAVAARVAMEAELRRGLPQGQRKSQFIIQYQPQVNRLGQVTGAEALVRWEHPQRGMLSPAEFIPLTEQTELILPLGLWVLASACEQLSAWAKKPEMAQLTLAVNVSARQFRQPNFVGQVLSTLDGYGADPRKLKLEITESMLLDDIEQIIAKMAELKARGVGFSLDDFGTGYSSLSYLKRLPLDQLKIDQSFVRDVLIDPVNSTIARTIVALAHNLGLAVIAEGVETEEQLLFLAGCGCHAYQGYLFSHPLPPEEFEKFARRFPSTVSGD